MTRARPLLLRSDNFTPASRTPWGGTKIVERYKVGVLPSRSTWHSVGESWEVSVEPDFPSLTEAGESLDELVRASPIAYLGAKHAERAPSTELLVKLLDAADDLSVQIHPSDDYRRLAPNESGKPESWYVLDRRPGAGLYLGLAEGVDERRMRDTLDDDGDVSALLVFVPVEPGDFFVIDAGTPHAVGRGVTLVEPQRVIPGKRGVTYRYWDWNRRYDAEGQSSATGKPRSLHVEDALAVTNWSLPRGQGVLSRIRHRAGPARVDGSPKLEPLCGRSGPARSEHLDVARLVGTGPFVLEPAPRLRAITVVGGLLRVDYGDGMIVAACGRSVVLPASVGRLDLELERCHAVVSSVA